MRSLLAGVLTATVLGVVPPAAGAPDDERVAPQTSEGVRGPAAAPRVGRAGWRTTVTEPVVETIAPGVEYSTWTTQSDPARDPSQVHLLDVDPALARLELVTGSPVRKRRVVTSLVESERGVAGINGDFFDIGDTGAPLGQSVDPRQGLRTGRSSGWNRAFWIDGSGAARIGSISLGGRIRDRWRIRHLNAPTVFPGNIGVYTPAWGRTIGSRVTDGRTRHVREVVVEHGRVVTNRRTLSSGRWIRGRVLIGRGEGADQLRALRKGQRVGMRWWMGRDPRLAIGGSQVVLSAGTVRTTDDTELHPRSAVGIDRDDGHYLLMVVDGRSESSSGVTLVELARLLRDSGAEIALNLDGGGSSTLVGRQRGLGLQMLNQPSDGQQRRVPNGLAVLRRWG